MTFSQGNQVDRTRHLHHHAYFFLIPFLLQLLITGGCASLPENTEQTPSTAIQNVDDTRFGQAVAQKSNLHPGKSGFLLLGNGLDAFVARVVLANLADRSLDVQYYLFHDDQVGGLLAYQLLQAADRGVRVR